jgi:hypothetical protein
MATPERLKDSHGLSPANTISPKAARVLGVQMVERGEERPESVKVSRDPDSFERAAEETYAIRDRRLQITKFCRARIFVSQENSGWTPAMRLEMAHQRWPWSTGPRAQIHYAFSAELSGSTIGSYVSMTSRIICKPSTTRSLRNRGNHGCS